MEIQQLYSEVRDGLWDGHQMIWKLAAPNSRIIADQYIARLGEAFKLQPRIIESFDDIAPSGFNGPEYLYVYITDDLKDYKKIPWTIIVCNNTTEECTELPLVEEWQFKNYLAAKVFIDEGDLDYLLALYEGNWTRLENDLDKVTIFPKELQQMMFDQLLDAGDFSEVSKLDINDFANAMLKKDMKIIKEVLIAAPYIDFEPPLFPINTLTNNFKKIVNIQLNTNATPQNSGCSEKQFYYLKKNLCKYYSNEELLNIYKLLTDVEMKFKFEGVPMDLLTDYVICQVLGGM